VAVDEGLVDRLVGEPIDIELTAFDDRERERDARHDLRIGVMALRETSEAHEARDEDNRGNESATHLASAGDDLLLSRPAALEPLRRAQVDSECRCHHVAASPTPPPEGISDEAGHR
jgi:hypothetical protein